MKVPCHTNKAGLYGLYVDLESCTSVKPHPWGCRTDNRIVSFSNKPPIIQGSRPFPTNYWRKAWVVQGSTYELESPILRSRGDSRIFGGFKTITDGSNFDYPQTYTPPWMENEAISSCRDKLREFRTLILEELAQAKKTAKLLMGILKAIVKVVRSITRRNFSRAISDAREAISHVFSSGTVTRETEARVKGAARWAHQFPKESVSQYLAWRYGVLPLASTFEALASGCAVQKLKSKTVKASRKQPANAEAFVASYGTTVMSGGAEFSVGASMTAEVKISAFTNLQNILGFTRWDTIATLWALVPYSFVVDWFIPVQQWLQNQEFSSGINYLYGHVTRRHWCDAKFRVLWGVPYTDAESVGTWPEFRIKAIHMVRDASIGIPPVPGLVIKTVLSSTNQLDALALALQKVM